MKVLYSLSWWRVNEGNEPFLACVVFFSLFWVLFTTLTFYLHYLHYYILKHYILRHKTMNLQQKLRFILENQHSFLHFYYGKKSIYTPKWGFLCWFRAWIINRKKKFFLVALGSLKLVYFFPPPPLYYALFWLVSNWNIVCYVLNYKINVRFFCVTRL